MSYTVTDHFVVTPALMLLLFGCGALFATRRWALAVLLAGLSFTAAALLRQQFYLDSHRIAELTAFGGALTCDRFSLFFNWLFLVSSGIVAVVSFSFLESAFAEFAALMLFAQCGMFFLAGGTDLITLFLGLELMGICFYVMVGYARGDRRSNEAALKYLILGAFSSGLLIYGFSLLYGLTGSTSLRDIANSPAVEQLRDPWLLLALTAGGAGLLFKISAVPFHTWAPDAYEGAPTPVTAYLAAASQAASFALLMRVMLLALAPARAVWQPLISLAAVASLTLGNLAAIAQGNVKRLLAYGSISHAGYLLLGLVAGNATGIRGVGVYLLTYTFMTLGAFLVVIALRSRGIAGDEVADFAGLAHRNPFYAVLMLVFLLSLAGIPPTAGFLGKYYILQALIETGHYTLAAIGTLYVVVALVYYFRIVRVMFTAEPETRAPVASGIGLRLALGISGAFTLGVGIYPEPFLRLAENSFAP